IPQANNPRAQYAGTGKAVDAAATENAAIASTATRNWWQKNRSKGGGKQREGGEKREAKAGPPHPAKIAQKPLPNPLRTKKRSPPQFPLPIPVPRLFPLPLSVFMRERGGEGLEVF